MSANSGVSVCVWGGAGNKVRRNNSRYPPPGGLGKCIKSKTFIAKLLICINSTYRQRVIVQGCANVLSMWQQRSTFKLLDVCNKMQLEINTTASPPKVYVTWHSCVWICGLRNAVWKLFHSPLNLS